LRSGFEAEEARQHRGNKSLEDSRINRDGLPVGTHAPDFRLTRVDGGELSLDDYREKSLLLVFSDPECGPCNQLMPELERVHRRSPDLQVLMVSRGDREANLAKGSEHGITFPMVLQRKWEISREYGIFATPVAYLIDEPGIIADVAVGPGPILSLAYGEEHVMREQMQARLEVLSKEYETGRAELQQVEERAAFLRETLLRIEGAKQVLRELLPDGQAVEQKQENGNGRVQSELNERSGVANQPTTADV
jgi:peroxiredoxin